MWWAESHLTPYGAPKRRRTQSSSDVSCPLTADSCVSLPTSLCDQVSSMTDNFQNLGSFTDVTVNDGKFNSLERVEWLRAGVVKEVRDKEGCLFVQKQDQSLTRVLKEILISTYLFCTVSDEFKKHIQEPIAICAPQYRVLYKKAGVFEMGEYLKNFYSTAEEDFLTLFKQLCTLLSYLQTKYEFVHGDLKLDNLIVDHSDQENIQVVLIDFGFSSLNHPATNDERLHTIPRTSNFHESYDLLFLLMHSSTEVDYMKNMFPDVFSYMKTTLKDKVKDREQSILWRKMYNIDWSFLPKLTPGECLEKLKPTEKQPAKSTVQPSSATPS